jgi:Trp operon repressor
MPTENGSERPERRIVLRRSRGQGARFSGRGRVDGAPREIEPDEIDTAIDPEEADRHVRTLASQPPPDDDDDGNPGDGLDPRQRLFDVAQAGSAEYSKEYRLMLLHRLLIRKMPLDQIAQQLGVSISTVQKDRAALKKHLATLAKDMNIDEMIGNQSLLYDEIAAMSLRIATKTSGNGATPIAMQLAAMRTTLASQADKTRFLQSAGVFDVLRFRIADSGKAQSDIQLLMEETRKMFAALNNDDAGEGMGGFEAFNLNELDPESEEL